MIYLILIKNKALVLLCFVFIASCIKETVFLSPGENYISSAGGHVVEDLNFPEYEIIVPPNALLADQYCSHGIQTEGEIGLIIDSTFSFAPLSSLLRFSRYNCDSFLLPATIKLLKYKGGHGHGLEFTAANARPFFIDNSADIRNFNNWVEINTFTEDSSGYSRFVNFELTDLTKTYFIGWTSN